MANVHFPSPGCVVEYLEDNAPQIAVVLELNNGRARLLLPSRKEVKLAQNRLLPWTGPAYPADLSREEYVRILEKHKLAREQKARTINPLELWDLAAGEIDQAETVFFAELVESEPTEDDQAAYGRAILECKTHFRFQPPYFLVFDRELVEKRLEEKKAREEREAIICGGSNFLRALWEIASKKRSAGLQAEELPAPELGERIEKLLHSRLINPDTTDDESLWQMLAKSLPDAPHLPLQLLIAWGKLPPHYNFWLERAGYEPGDQWWQTEEKEVANLVSLSQNADLPVSDLKFISIDSEKTRDIDDAFHLEKTPEGWRLTLALASPAIHWPFGEALDKKVAHRSTSIYLPEGDLHMLPESLGTGAYSLRAGESRPAFCMSLDIDHNGGISSFTPFLARVTLAANMDYDKVQKFIDNAENDQDSASPLAAFGDQLLAAHQMAQKRENHRIGNGAVIMQTREQTIKLKEIDGELAIDLVNEPENADSHRMVAEMMIAASCAFAEWAHANNLPVIYRTQNVTVPREYAGVWSRPDDLARIMKCLTHSILETDPRPHAAIGADCYAPITSPLRRYTDLLNEAQAIHFMRDGSPRWSKDALSTMLDNLSPDIDSASQVQRFRPRYWRLHYLRQQGDKKWWHAVITDENENFVTVQIPDAGVLVRGRRSLFDERVQAGGEVLVRLGKINPLYNEIQILEVSPYEQAGEGL